MIRDKAAVWHRLTNFAWQAQPLTSTVKTEHLKQAIVDSVEQACSLFDGDPVHLALSGGVDSSLVLAVATVLQYPVVAHTIGSSEHHPDMVHAGLMAKHVGAWWMPHVITPTPQDVQLSNEVFGTPDRQRADNYWYLFREVHTHTSRLLTCDCIDELLGGYYDHNTPDTFDHFVQRLIPNHLAQSNKASSHWGVDVVLPYADPAVLEAAAAFEWQEMVAGKLRKQPIYAIAREFGVPDPILRRRKLGLVSAINVDQGRKPAA